MGRCCFYREICLNEEIIMYLFRIHKSNLMFSFKDSCLLGITSLQGKLLHFNMIPEPLITLTIVLQEPKL